MSETNQILPVIANRWSPYAFKPESIDAATLHTLFTAASWAASSFNEQPWRFIIATQAQPEQFARILSTLVPKNQAWAKNAWVLGITVAKKTFTHNDTPNRCAINDSGAALATLMIQATAFGLHVHGMAGFDVELARTGFGVPDGFMVNVAFALGHVDGSPEPPAGRTRKPLNEWVFRTEWGKPAL